jgi:hypothetical protein
VIPDASRLFSMSAFEALRSIRIYRRNYPRLPVAELTNLIISIDPGGFDYAAAGHLDRYVPASAEPHKPATFYRACIEGLIQQKPIWMKTVVLGRRKFTQKLSRDEEQCFRLAGLLDDKLDSNVVDWWDMISSQMRRLSSEDAMRRARAAERLSLQYECKRLERFGILKPPIWMSIEDNTAGYDILSYDPGNIDPINKLIEVKSTVASPARFFVTRNEWNTALKFAPRYYFHIWDLHSDRLYECTAAEIAMKIPSDNEPRGRWTTAEIRI